MKSEGYKFKLNIFFVDLPRFAAFCLLSCIFFSCTPSKNTLSVMSYNIHRGQNEDNQDKLREMADFILSSEADVIGLQEVDSVCYRSDQVDQAERLAELTGMYCAFVRHFAFQGGAYGQALLSRYPIGKVENHRLPIASDPPGETRAFLTAEIEIRPGEKWLVGVAHLDYRDPDSRVRQAEMINRIYQESDLPGILVGDMNAEPATPEIRMLLSYFQDTHPDDALTFPVAPPKKKIDYILIDKDINVKIVDRSVPAVDFSDHLPVLTSFEY